MGAAFILNLIALLLFPLIGYAEALHSWGGFKLTRLAWVIRAVGKVPDTNCYGTSYHYSSSQRKSLYSSAGFQIYQWVEKMALATLPQVEKSLYPTPILNV